MGWRDFAGDIAGGLGYILNPGGGASSQKRGKEIAAWVKGVKPQQLQKGSWGQVGGDIARGAMLAAPFVTPAAAATETAAEPSLWEEAFGPSETGPNMSKEGIGEALKQGTQQIGASKKGAALQALMLGGGALAGEAIGKGIGGKKGKKGQSSDSSGTDSAMEQALRAAGWTPGPTSQLSKEQQAYATAHGWTAPVTPQAPLVDPLAMQSFWANSIAPMLQNLSQQQQQTSDQYGTAMQSVLANPNLPPAYKAVLQAQIPQEQADMSNVATAEQGAALAGPQYDQMVNAINQALQQQYKTQLAGGASSGISGIP